MGIDVREIWDFNDPASSEKRFRAILRRKTLSHDEKLEIWAQIARTFSLRNQCPQCHAILDEFWEDAMAAGPRPKACFELEKGRGFRTAGEPRMAIPYFQIAAESEEEDLKIDAIHMLAVVATGAESHRLNLEALTIAQSSSNPWAQRWQGTLFNNLGWGSFDEGRFDEAVEWFRKALFEREKYGNEHAIRVAKWCLGRGLRAVCDFEGALVIQRELAQGEADGYVHEELGEILEAIGQSDDAKAHFRIAADKLEAEYGVDSEKIQRLRSRA